MLRIKLILSGSLRQIYKDKQTEIPIKLENSTTVKNLICSIGINPIVVTNVFINGKVESKDYLITTDQEIVLLGPLAGG